MNILIPAAGLGERFKAAGYDKPKPLVDVLGKPMLSRVMDNLRPMTKHRFVIVSRMDDDDVRPLLTDDDVTIHLDKETEGAVDTILRAREYLTAEPLLLANCDQLCDFNVDDFLLAGRGSDGALVTFKSNKAHHSYITERHIAGGYSVIDSIAEKQVISNKAVTGVYWFRHGSDFLHYAEQVMNANDRFRSEFYVSSVIRRMLDDGLSFVAHDAPSISLGTPEELQLFEVAVMMGKVL